MHVEPLGERAYFSAVHYLALVCSDEALVERLRSRPAWRGATAPELVVKMRDFNAWIRESAAKTTPPMTLLDASDLSLERAVAFTVRWIRERLG